MKPVSGNKIKTIGVMSGTSLDGLDIVAAVFYKNKGEWQFTIEAAETIDYSADWNNKLKTAPQLTGEKLIALDAEYGHLIGEKINEFNLRHSFSPELISSHGHTVFHRPEKGFTYQIGNGAQIAACTKIATVCDFRTLDVALGGQGAPLVPVGDKLLFNNYNYCLNLGGFSNISFDKNGQRIAFDICPTNIVINLFANKFNAAFDKNGELGKKGKVCYDLLNALNNLDYYKCQAPKSLGREWVESTFLPLVNSFHESDTDKLRTIYEHIAIQISRIGNNGKMLVTGGGAHNSFLINLIKKYSPQEIILPETEIIDFKEALIFAFLGVLKIKKQINCLASVTGASKDSVVGTVYYS